jgi:hypothetical protein
VLNEARRGAGVKAEARPLAGRSRAQSLDAGEHRTTLHLATAGLCTKSTLTISAAREFVCDMDEVEDTWKEP